MYWIETWSNATGICIIWKPCDLALSSHKLGRKELPFSACSCLVVEPFVATKLWSHHLTSCTTDASTPSGPADSKVKTLDGCLQSEHILAKKHLRNPWGGTVTPPLSWPAWHVGNLIKFSIFSFFVWRTTDQCAFLYYCLNFNVIYTSINILFSIFISFWYLLILAVRISRFFRMVMATRRCGFAREPLASGDHGLWHSWHWRWGWWLLRLKQLHHREELGTGRQRSFVLTGGWWNFLDVIWGKWNSKGFSKFCLKLSNVMV